MQDDLLTPQEVATTLRLNVLTLANWRTQGKFLKFIKIGRAVRYKISDIEDFISKQTQDHSLQ